LASLVPGETLRVLLVSTSEEARDEVGAALAGRAGDHRLYWVSQPDLAPVRASDLLPHVVLVDDSLDKANVVMLIGQLLARVPQAAILALVASEDMLTARQAVLAGARAFITKPVQPEELLAALRQVLVGRAAPRSPEPMTATAGRIIVFCAPKGGTGRTILATNTAVALRRLSKNLVALIDADYSAPAVDVALNLESDRTIVDLLPKLANLDAEVVSSVLASHASGVQVLLAPPPADLSHPISLPQVQQVLAWLKRMFPWVLVDLGLPMDDTAFAFLDGADRIVMSVLPEMVGLRNTRLMLDQLHARGYPGEKIWMVLNRSTLRGGVPVRDIEERLRVHIRFQVPDDQPLATHSINRGVPIVVSHEGSAVARAVQKLARDLLAELPVSTNAANPENTEGAGKPARHGLFGRG
jgi:pilus assembly protein CpaE